MIRAIDSATTGNYPDDYTINWILTDNTTRPTTKTELEKVRLAKSMREHNIFVVYESWLSGGMVGTFEPPEEETYFDV